MRPNPLLFLLLSPHLFSKYSVLQSLSRLIEAFTVGSVNPKDDTIYFGEIVTLETLRSQYHYYSLVRQLGLLRGYCRQSPQMHCLGSWVGRREKKGIPAISGCQSSSTMISYILLLLEDGGWGRDLFWDFRAPILLTVNLMESLSLSSTVA